MSIRHRSDRIVALVATSIVVCAPASRADEDPLAPYRDRFRQGMEKYKVGAMAEAIRTWGAIYDEIGPQRGYRLSFNLARAYEANSETSRAAERYRSFLDEVAVRRASGEALDPIVAHEAEEADARLAELDAKNGRIRVVSSGGPVLAQIDASDPRLGTFVGYVAPGEHVVVFSPGSPAVERRDVHVQAGELVVVSPTPPPPPPPPELTLPPVSTEPARLKRLVLERPFTPVVLYVSASLTAASVALPIATYAHAASLGSDYYASGTPLANKPALAADYSGARTVAYATIAVPLAVAAITGALTYYYFGGAKTREVTVDAGALPGGAAASLRVVF